jgi:Txe/YoeB family toxin of Txe-Axe toxin-antitoxin module
MFHEDGTMRKSCKSDIVKQFENEVSPVLSLPDFDPSLTTYIGSVMVSFTWFTIAWTCSSSRFKAVCFISSCEVLLVLVIPALSFIALLNDARKCLVSVQDEEQVQAIVNHLNETMTDPFDIEVHPPYLMNISTGMYATREVQDSLMFAVNEEEKKFISPISQNQSTSENNFWIDMTSYNFTRVAFQGCFGIHVFKCFQF